jgi:DNA-3-methyladenine glycosylase II
MSHFRCVAEVQPPVARPWFFSARRWYSEAMKELARKDEILARIIRQVGPCALKADRTRGPYQALVESVVYQQLTGKAAATILGRVRDLFPGRGFPKPEQILAMPDAKLRAAGLSGAKTAAIKDIARKALDGTIPDTRRIHKLSDDEIIERLTQIRGVGRWTVEMLLIFKLGRPDVFPSTDYGVRKGHAWVYGRAELLSPLELQAISEKWKPFRSAAAWYFWRALELPEAKVALRRKGGAKPAKKKSRKR